MNRREQLEIRLYRYFERTVSIILTLLLAVIVIAALLHLTLNIAHAVLFTSFDPTRPLVFQDLFGGIFTVIIALEFKRSILVTAEHDEGAARVRIVILIGMLAIARKLIILDLSHVSAAQLLGLSAAFFSLGVVYWLVRDQDRRS
ncbi:MAG TPA: phosphate-starvation-inducible PsiE family protein [Acidiphilium sp.]|nr:MAG: protein PsiE [Acidiphilium sp. 21-60-14]OYV90987.1 MAG: protein PsiE [Acidiphilium sp. 37-60-79]OZB38888.1 MAG: protein PsiE [Acidiphilium sp. 34-60-192]HQT88588.1 phosphate-starvation-inducible PsiE family protein [Acidiphilium sp.]HQU24538.1 phosphate-starvation-inducible PsiE family protein [Acidiphilium sp.]